MSIFLRDYYGESRLTAVQVVKDPVLLLAFGFGSGLSRYIPGTFGTVAAIPLYWGLQYADVWVYGLATLVAFIVGIRICDSAANKLKVHDFGGIVWDEFVGFLITMIAIPFSWQSLAAGFLLFRVFDIVKPWPIGWLDRRVAGGFGIMIDDVVAGIFAAVVLRFWF